MGKVKSAAKKVTSKVKSPKTSKPQKVEVKAVEEVVEEKVVQHLDRDPNDPRNVPVIDGNDLPKVDITKPAK